MADKILPITGGCLCGAVRFEATEPLRGSPIVTAECVRRPTVNPPAFSWGSRGHKKGRYDSPRVCRSITSRLLGWSAASAPTVAARLGYARRRDTVLWSAPSITLKNGHQTKLTRASRAKYHGTSSTTIFRAGEPRTILNLLLRGRPLNAAKANIMVLIPLRTVTENSSGE